MPFRARQSSLPLTPLSFELLLALLGGDQHGYGILQTVDARVNQWLPLRTGTIYRALARLMAEGLIAEASVTDGSDERRRTYKITAAGRQIARAEAERLAGQVAAARAHRLLPAGKR